MSTGFLFLIVFALILSIFPLIMFVRFFWSIPTRLEEIVEELKNIKKTLDK